jgi:hypothetical protein
MRTIENPSRCQDSHLRSRVEKFVGNNAQRVQAFVIRLGSLSDLELQAICNLPMCNKRRAAEKILNFRQSQATSEPSRLRKSPQAQAGLSRCNNAKAYPRSTGLVSGDAGNAGRRTTGGSSATGHHRASVLPVAPITGDVSHPCSPPPQRGIERAEMPLSGAGCEHHRQGESASSESQVHPKISQSGPCRTEMPHPSGPSDDAR